jgi:hypothetical protein
VLAVVVVLSIFTVVPFERLYSIHVSARSGKTLTLFFLLQRKLNRPLQQCHRYGRCR